MSSINYPRVLIPETKIKQRIQELAQEIAYDYKGKELTAICVLKGSYIFFADLVRKMELPISCEFIGMSSYGQRTTSSGEVKITLDMTEPVAGKHLLIVEDIVDSGLTMQYMLGLLKARKPASIKVCTLLLKPESMKTEVQMDYVGFKIGNDFVVGYGLDFQGKYRQVPYIGVLDHESIR